MHDPIDLITGFGEDAAWRAVPGDVAELVRQLVEPMFKRAFDASTLNIDLRLYWNPITDDYECNYPSSPDYLLCKAAAEDFLRPVADGFKALQNPLGGPNPLTSAIVGGVIGSGLGYGGGYLGEKLMGDQAEPGKLRRSMALAGGALGSMAGVVPYGVNLANPKATGNPLQAAISRWPDVPGLDEPPGGDPHLSSFVPPVTKTRFPVNPFASDEMLGVLIVSTPGHSEVKS